MQLSHALAGSEPDELRRFFHLEAVHGFLSPNQRSRGHGFNGIRPHSAVVGCVRTPRIHAVL